MADQDLFGFTRDIKPNGALITAEVAAISIGGTGTAKLSLVQSVKVDYQQRTEPRYEAGTSNVYWVTGQPSGTINISRLVSSSGFELFKNASNAKCELKTVNLSFESNGGKCMGKTKDNLRFSGVVVANVGMSYSAAGFDVAENMSLKVAALAAMR